MATGYVTSTKAGTVMISAEAVVEGEEVSAHTRVLFLPEVVPVITTPGKTLKITLPEDKVKYSANRQRKAEVVGVDVMIKPEGEKYFREADFAIAKGLRPQIRFDFYPSIRLFDVAWVQEFPLPWPYPLPLGIAIHVDDGSDETSLDRKTFDAIKDDPAFRVDVENNSVTWDLTKYDTSPLMLGTNRIKVLAEIHDPLATNQWAEGVAIAGAGFLVYTEQHDIIVSPLTEQIDAASFIDTATGEEIKFIRDTVTIDFIEDSDTYKLTDRQISYCFRINVLTPIGVIRDINVAQGKSLWPMSYSELQSLAERVRIQPIVEQATISVLVEPDSVATEDIPANIRQDFDQTVEGVSSGRFRLEAIRNS
jgi:hypothetical protein